MDISVIEIILLKDIIHGKMILIQEVQLGLRLRMTEDISTLTQSPIMILSLMKVLQSTTQEAFRVTILLTIMLPLLTLTMTLTSTIETMIVMVFSPVSAPLTLKITTIPTTAQLVFHQSLQLDLRSRSTTIKASTLMLILIQMAAPVLTPSVCQTSGTAKEDHLKSTILTSTTGTHLTTTGMTTRSEEWMTTLMLVQLQVSLLTDTSLESQLHSLTTNKKSMVELSKSDSQNNAYNTVQATEDTELTRLCRQANTFIERFAIVKLSRRYNCDKALYAFALLFLI